MRVVTAVARRVGWYWGRERWVCVRVKGERVVRRASMGEVSKPGC